jgi:HlyD family secretion protein
VVEVKASEGQLVDRGSGLVSIEASGADINEIEAYIYLPAADGKKTKAGMKVEISPSTARREEFGFLPGLITGVADYPSSDQGLMRVFGNEKVVQQLAGTAPPIQVLAALKPSTENPSHYEWSTRSGPPFLIQSGTSCSANITLSEQRPIALVMPILKKTLGLD